MSFLKKMDFLKFFSPVGSRRKNLLETKVVHNLDVSSFSY